MEKKKRIILTIIVVSTVLMLVGTSLAYYASSVLGTGNSNNNKLSASAVKLGSIYYDGVTTFTSTNMYPGQKFVQEFIVGPQGSEGVGIYGINLEASVPEAFGSDVKISLYKTTDKTNNNVVRTEGTLIQNGNQYYQEDTITVNGSPELLYGPEVLTSTSLLELESVQFDVTTLEHTTYYLVYEYANNGNQDAQQGLSFSGKITVNLTSLSEDVFDPAKPMLFADYIDKLAENGSTELAYGDVGDNAVRYYGANPNNYVDIGDKYSSNIYRGYLNTQIFHSISEVSETYKAFDSLEECQNDPDYNWNCTYFAQPYKAYLNQELVTSSKEFQEYYCEDSEYNYNCTYTRTIYVVHGYYLSSDGVPEGDPVEYIGEDAMGECQALGDKMCMEMEVRNMYTGYYNTVGNNVYKIVDGISNCTSGSEYNYECTELESEYKNKYIGYYNSLNKNLYQDETEEYICRNNVNFYNYGCEIVHAQNSPRLWRAIGRFINGSGGNNISTVKLVREDSIGNYSWDSSHRSVNQGIGINEWSIAAANDILNKMYNNYYYTSGNCYIGAYDEYEYCSFYGNSFPSASSNYIANAYWALGTNGSSTFADGSPRDMYVWENSDNNGKICTADTITNGFATCTDTVVRKTSWQGSIGLISASDYGFATGGGSVTRRDLCVHTALDLWNNYSDCYQNNWLYNPNYDQWLINPVANVNFASGVAYISKNGSVGWTSAERRKELRPSIYLNENAYKNSGTGTALDPYVITLKS